MLNGSCVVDIYWNIPLSLLFKTLNVKSIASLFLILYQPKMESDKAIVWWGWYICLMLNCEWLDSESELLSIVPIYMCM